MKNLAEMGRRAKKAAENLALASSGEKDRGLAAIAAALRAHTEELLAANGRDTASAAEGS